MSETNNPVHGMLRTTGFMTTLFAIMIAGPQSFANPEPDCGPGSVDPRCMAAYSKMIEDKASTKEKRAAAYLLRGLSYSRQGRQDLAESDFTAVIDYGPESNLEFYSEALEQRGLIYHTKQKFDDAIKDFTVSVDANPKRWKAYKMRAYAHGEKQNLKRAFEDATMAIELQANDVDIYVLRGTIYKRLDLNSYAEADYRKALSLKPSSERVETIREYIMNLGVTP